jgi:hypothetical protein
VEALEVADSAVDSAVVELAAVAAPARSKVI